MTSLTLADILLASAKDDLATIVPVNASVSIIHRELRQQGEEAQELFARLSHDPGSIVAICPRNSLPFAVSFLATTWQWSAATPQNPAYTQDKIESHIDDLGVSAVFVPRDSYKKGTAAASAARKYRAAIVESYSSEAN